VGIVLAGYDLHTQLPAQSPDLIGSAEMLTRRIDVGIVEKGGELELLPQNVDDTNGAWGTADMQQQALLETGLSVTATLHATLR
jgi:hypothetical protein